MISIKLINGIVPTLRQILNIAEKFWILLLCTMDYIYLTFSNVAGLWTSKWCSCRPGHLIPKNAKVNVSFHTRYSFIFQSVHVLRIQFCCRVVNISKMFMSPWTFTYNTLHVESIVPFGTFVPLPNSGITSVPSSLICFRVIDIFVVLIPLDI